MFLSNNFGRVIQEIHLTDDDLQLLALITRELRSYIHNLDNCRCETWRVVICVCVYNLFLNLKKKITSQLLVA